MRRTLFSLVPIALAACAPRDAPRKPSAPSEARATPAPAPSASASCERLPTGAPFVGEPYPEAVTWSSDGALIAAAIGQTGVASQRVEGAESVVVWSVTDGAPQKRYRLSTQAVAFAHTSQRLAFGSVSESGVIDLRTDCVLRWPRPGPLLAWALDDGALFLGSDTGVSAVQSAGGAILRQWLAPAGSPRIVSMDVGRANLALGDEVHQVQIVSLDLAHVESLPGTVNAIGNGRAVAMAPDGSRVASTTVQEIPVKYPPGTMPGSPTTHRFSVRVMSLPRRDVTAVFPGDADALAFSPDGASLAMAGTTEERLTVHVLATGETRVLDLKTSFAQQIAWSPDGRSIALADWRGAVRVYDASGVKAPRALVP